MNKSTPHVQARDNYRVSYSSKRQITRNSHWIINSQVCCSHGSMLVVVLLLVLRA
jgi:hypothetical protein